MKKLLLSSLLAVILLSAITGSIAYFTDSVSTTNTLTAGNLDVELHEYERVKNEDGTYALRTYTQEQKVYPRLKDAPITRESFVVNEHPVNMPVVGSNGFIDKIVVSENVGTLNVYVRTYVAVPTYGGTSLLTLERNETDWTWFTLANQTIDGMTYDIHVATYKELLAPEAFTAPSLLGFYLDSALTKETGARLLDQKGNLNIRVATQATQANVFEGGAKAALDTVFGANSHPWLPTDGK